MPRSTLVAVLVLTSLAAGSLAKDSAEEPRRVVFLKQLGRGEGAPSAKALEWTSRGEPWTRSSPLYTQTLWPSPRC